MTETIQQTTTDTSQKARKMRVLSGPEIFRAYHRFYSPSELAAIVAMARRIPAFNMTFADGRREFFDFRRAE